jgi:hypothetical protein
VYRIKYRLLLSETRKHHRDRRAAGFSVAREGLMRFNSKLWNPHYSLAKQIFFMCMVEPGKLRRVPNVFSTKTFKQGCNYRGFLAPGFPPQRYQEILIIGTHAPCCFTMWRWNHLLGN